MIYQYTFEKWIPYTNHSEEIVDMDYIQPGDL